MLENEGASEMDSQPVWADHAHLSDSPFIHLRLFTMHKNKADWCAMELKLELVYIFNKMNISAAFWHLTQLEISFQIKVPLGLYYPSLISFQGEGQGSLIRYI